MINAKIQSAHQEKLDEEKAQRTELLRGGECKGVE